jgi:hypothetical protein
MYGRIAFRSSLGDVEALQVDGDGLVVAELSKRWLLTVWRPLVAYAFHQWRTLLGGQTLGDRQRNCACDADGSRHPTASHRRSDPDIVPPGLSVTRYTFFAVLGSRAFIVGPRHKAANHEMPCVQKRGSIENLLRQFRLDNGKESAARRRWLSWTL